MPEKDAILERAKKLQPDLTELRRTIHQNPELGFEEVETARLVANTLRELGLRVEEGAVEFLGVVDLEVGGDVDEEGKGRRVRLGETKIGEGGELIEDLVRRFLADAVADHSFDQLHAQRFHLFV